MRFDYLIETPCETPGTDATTTTGTDSTSTTGGDSTTTTGTDSTSTTGSASTTSTAEASACAGCQDPVSVAVANSVTYDGDWTFLTWNPGGTCIGVITGPSPGDAFDGTLQFVEASDKWRLDLDNGNFLLKTTTGGCPIGDYEGEGSTAGWTATVT